jgi:hypothetical protein
VVHQQPERERRDQAEEEVIWQVNTREDYDVIEAEEMEVDSSGMLIALDDGVAIAGWAPGFWYGFKTTESEVKDGTDHLSEVQEQRDPSGDGA